MIACIIGLISLLVPLQASEYRSSYTKAAEITALYFLDFGGKPIGFMIRWRRHYVTSFMPFICLFLSSLNIGFEAAIFTGSLTSRHAASTQMVTSATHASPFISFSMIFDAAIELSKVIAARLVLVRTRFSLWHLRRRRRLCRMSSPKASGMDITISDRASMLTHLQNERTTPESHAISAMPRRDILAILACPFYAAL